MVSEPTSAILNFCQRKVSQSPPSRGNCASGFFSRNDLFAFDFLVFDGRRLVFVAVREYPCFGRTTAHNDRCIRLDHLPWPHSNHFHRVTTGSRLLCAVFHPIPVSRIARFCASNCRRMQQLISTFSAILTPKTAAETAVSPTQHGPSTRRLCSTVRAR